ncbi:acyl carrier protein [Achromobacter sp.]|uniref:acyl carrier protein n=1 Tax=Achromobacter sp. TaxID=134375 RepID=UPI0028A7DE0E|nr:phosphopantetheine-binding protein [Achromobacter sp.]
MQVTQAEIVAAIRQADVVDCPEKLRPDLKLTDQGIDSLDMFSVILALQEKYGIEISDDDIDGLHSIDQMAAYINARLN